MGCTTSTSSSEPGNKHHKLKSMKFDSTGVHDVDVYFNTARDFLKTIDDVLGPLSKSKKEFFEATGFHHVKGAGIFFHCVTVLLELKHAVQGMILYFSAVNNVSLNVLFHLTQNFHREI